LSDKLDVKYLLIKRDPRGVVYSRIKKILRSKNRISLGVKRFAYIVKESIAWRLFYFRAYIFLRSRSHLAVNYENFVADPRNWTDKMSCFGSGKRCDQTQFLDGKTIVLGVNHSVMGNQNRFKTGAVNIDEDTGWKDKLTPWESRIVRILSGWDERLASTQ
jgi:hypothetical protein